MTQTILLSFIVEHKQKSFRSNFNHVHAFSTVYRSINVDADARKLLFTIRIMMSTNPSSIGSLNFFWRPVLEFAFQKCHLLLTPRWIQKLPSQSKSLSLDCETLRIPIVESITKRANIGQWETFRHLIRPNRKEWFRLDTMYNGIHSNDHWCIHLVHPTRTLPSLEQRLNLSRGRKQAPDSRLALSTKGESFPLRRKRYTTC